MRANGKDEEEWEDLDSDGCRMLEKVYGRQKLKMATEGS
jgi:hypothetical protein